jgi:hypothetical protein
MTTVFIDESGDLGFDFSKAGTSAFFLVAAWVCADIKPTNKAVNRVFKGFTKAEVKRHNGLLHAYKEQPATVRKLLTGLVKTDGEAFAVILNKRKLANSDTVNLHGLYNELVAILLHRIVLLSSFPHGSIRLVAAARETHRDLNREFVERIKTTAGKRAIDLTVEVTPVSAHKGLQVADCLAWSLYQEVANVNGQFISILRQRLIEKWWAYE